MDTLRIYGNLSLLEMAPVLLAAEKIYPGKTAVEHGSVMSLWGAIERSREPRLRRAIRHCDEFRNAGAARRRRRTRTCALSSLSPSAPTVSWRAAPRASARLADLRGKRVGTQLESSAAYFLDSMLRTAGLTEEDVVSVPFMAKTAGAAHPASGSAAKRRDRCSRAVGAAGAASEARHRRATPSSFTIPRSTPRNSISAPRKPISTILRCGSGSSLSCGR